MLERISVVAALGVEYCHCRRHLLVGNMVVAYNEIYAQRFGISYLLGRLYSAVENYYQLHVVRMRIVYSFLAYTVSFVVAVGNIVFYV